MNAESPRDNLPALPDFSRNDGLLPAIAQDAETGEVLMIAYMNREAYDETRRSGRAVYWSRSRNELWRKGEQSGHLQKVRSIRIDCDADAILLQVDQTGAACHEGYRSCFFRELRGDSFEVTATRLADPDTIYRK